MSLNIFIIIKMKKMVKRRDKRYQFLSLLQRRQRGLEMKGDADFLNEADDDGNAPMSFIIPSRRRSRAKKPQPRVWYDEERMHPEQQFMLRL